MNEQGLSTESTEQLRSPIRDGVSGVAKRSRGRTGCLNCRRRRKKCDEGKPACAKCTSRGESCRWDNNITFRLSGIDTYHPSMVHARSLKSQNEPQIMNIVFDEIAGAPQHSHHEQPEDPLSPLNDSSIAEMQDNHYNENIARSNNNEQALTPLSSDSGRFSTDAAIMMGSPHETHPSTQSTGISDRLHISPSEPSNGPVGVNHHIENSNGKSQINHLERRNNAVPVSLSPVGAPASAESVTGLCSERPTSAVFGHLNSRNGETNLPAQTVPLSSDFEVLDYLTSQQNNFDFFTDMAAQQSGMLQCYPRSNSDHIHSPFATESALAGSVDSQAARYPNATYQDLHSTLYYHMVETARNTTLTRHATPEPFAQEGQIAHDSSPSSSNVDDMRSQIRRPSLRLQPLKSAKLTQRRQLELWRNYIDEIAVWLDMFDNDRHFQFSIPLLAKSADHLHYSILALSARQMERKIPNQPYTESLGLYQEAIQLIVKELYTLDTSVIASCVLLCVLEMMSSSPKAWCRHLDGCAMLLEAAGVNGVVGGALQSLFWCFARMDVWGGFLEDTLTKIPTSRWFIPSGTMIEAVAHFKAGYGSHNYANYAVFLCASVVNVLSTKTGSSTGQSQVDNSWKATYVARWKALFDLLEDWYNSRPEDMQPLMAYPSCSDDPQEPFPAVLYGSSPAVNGNELYHAAAILMLQDKPKGIRLTRSPKSILWHARQICGIAVSNSDHGARINSLQPLWIAGKIMSHETEHKAILELLAQIESCTGWATAWRAEDLKDYWGDSTCSDAH